MTSEQKKQSSEQKKQSLEQKKQSKQKQKQKQNSFIGTFLDNLKKESGMKGPITVLIKYTFILFLFAWTVTSMIDYFFNTGMVFAVEKFFKEIYSWVMFFLYLYIVVNEYDKAFLPKDNIKPIDKLRSLLFWISLINLSSSIIIFTN